MPSPRCLILAGWIALLGIARASAEPLRHGSLVTETIASAALRDNRIEIDPSRRVFVYLPPGYADDGNTRRYPVIYYFHSLFSSPQQMFADGEVVKLFDRSIARGAIDEFILVAADYSTPHVGCFFSNSPTSGRWLDFTTAELLPFVDQHFRTLPQRESRGLAGDMLGGYGAFKFAMLYPDLFSVVYALHPAGTGQGILPMADRPDWAKILKAKSWSDLDAWGYTPVFVAMAQAYLPNPNRPPFYCDFMMEPDAEGIPRLNGANVEKLKQTFALDRLLPAHAKDLRRMTAIKFDWGRYDENYDHVYANQAFTRNLDNLGIEHEAEEYRGNAWNRNWIPHGRVEDNMLPFFGRFLQGASNAQDPTSQTR